ncbi:hypothetical protein Bca4012_072641 [Brassica carinata]|uniref:Uncharacterized protein n=4 Tax=Brassica TaxID=3705 RepID=A0A8S9SA37_BRACR|nr:hypothetical protein F2Q69_00029478 [Brassica cretica]KAF3607976.1 hypothetical protein DY000_02048253 [Brassica cretica]KAG2270453.1 hypothetical protein Bca52824_065008 [Brassica carinata]CAF1929782.1 unnamed protein product [Brassica napus]
MDSLCGKGSALKVCEVIPGSCDGCLDHVGVVAPRLDEISRLLDECSPVKGPKMMKLNESEFMVPAASSVPVKRRLVSPVLTLSGEEAMAL